MKTFFKSFIIILSAAFIFSCSTEEGLEQEENLNNEEFLTIQEAINKEGSQGLRNAIIPFISLNDGEDGENISVRASIIPVAGSPTTSCRFFLQNYEEFTLSVFRSVIFTNLNLNPALDVTVSINDGNNPPYIRVVLIPENSLYGQIPLSQAIGGNIGHLAGPVTISVVDIVPSDNQSDISKYFAANDTSANLDCPF